MGHQPSVSLEVYVRALVYLPWRPAAWLTLPVSHLAGQRRTDGFVG